MQRTVGLLREACEEYCKVNNYNLSPEDETFFNRLHDGAGEFEEYEQERKKTIFCEERFSYGPFTIEIITEYTKSDDRHERYEIENYAIYFYGECRYNSYSSDEAFNLLVELVGEYVSRNHTTAKEYEPEMNDDYSSEEEESDEYDDGIWWRQWPPEATVSERVS